MTSATGGFLRPQTPGSDTAYQDLLNRLVVGLTGLPGDLVRPRWQVNPPPSPSMQTDWVGFGIVNSDRPASAVVLSDGTMLRTVRDDVLFSFYGPQSSVLAAVLADGLELSQNRDQLRAAGVGFIRVESSGPANELVNDQWLARWDLLVLLSREVRRNYSILPLVSTSGAIHANGPDPAIIIPY